MLLFIVLLVLLAISITALVIATTPSEFTISENYTKFPLLEQGTSFTYGSSIGVSANNNLNILYDYMVKKDVIIQAFYHDETLATGQSFKIGLSIPGDPTNRLFLILTENTYDLLPEFPQVSGSSFQYRYGIIENFAPDMTFTLHGLSTNPEKSKENNITALVYNSGFDDPFTILKRRNGKNFDKISFGTKFTLKA